MLPPMPTPMLPMLPMLLLMNEWQNRGLFVYVK